jgi:iron complex outermembrane receptor protein
VPTRFDTDLRIRIPNTSTIFLTGSTDFRPENVIAYEAGFRRQFEDRASIDIAAYVNRYDDLRTQEIGAPVTLGNGMNALSRGVESSASIQLLHWWQAHVSHTYLWKELTFDPDSRDPTHGVSEANDPKHIFKLRSNMNPVGALEIDGFFRYYGARPAPPVGDYGELDARVGYRIRPWWDVSVIGSNLLHERHVEFIAGTAPETYERSVRVRSIWRF